MLEVVDGVTAAPKRRWFRFSLRTLFVVVTVMAMAAAWLAWVISLDRQRIELRNSIFARGGRIEWDADYEFPAFWFREWICNDFPAQRIRVPQAHEFEFRAQVKRLFPEAEFKPLSKEELEQEARDAEQQLKDEAAGRLIWPSRSTPAPN
jgi:hypothetical protein